MKYIRASFFLFILFVHSGCFEVIEEVMLNDDGSGQITMTVNISRSKTKLKSIMLMDSINDYKVPSETDIKRNMSEMISEIKSIDGVGNVTHTMNFDDFIFSVTCDFENVDVLNSVITHFSTDSHKKVLEDNKQFMYNTDSKLFTRNYHYNLAEEIKKVKRSDKKVLEEASVTTIYRFESEIASVANESSRVAGNKKAVMLKVDVPDIIANKTSIKNSIKLQ